MYLPLLTVVTLIPWVGSLLTPASIGDEEDGDGDEGDDKGEEVEEEGEEEKGDDDDDDDDD